MPDLETVLKEATGHAYAQWSTMMSDYTRTYQGVIQNLVTVNQQLREEGEKLKAEIDRLKGEKATKKKLTKPKKTA